MKWRKFVVVFLLFAGCTTFGARKFLWRPMVWCGEMVIQDYGPKGETSVNLLFHEKEDKYSVFTLLTPDRTLKDGTKVFLVPASFTKQPTEIRITKTNDVSVVVGQGKEAKVHSVEIKALATISKDGQVIGRGAFYRIIGKDLF